MAALAAQREAVHALDAELSATTDRHLVGVPVFGGAWFERATDGFLGFKTGDFAGDYQEAMDVLEEARRLKREADGMEAEGREILTDPLGREAARLELTKALGTLNMSALSFEHGSELVQRHR